MAELIATLEAPVYVERVALCDNKHIMQARKAVKKALELQKQGAGFTMVEILSPCPTILKMEPTVARRWVGETLTKQFPLGVFRDRKPEIVSGGRAAEKRGGTAGHHRPSRRRKQSATRGGSVPAPRRSRLPALAGRAFCCSAS